MSAEACHEKRSRIKLDAISHYFLHSSTFPLFFVCCDVLCVKNPAAMTKENERTTGTTEQTEDYFGIKSMSLS